MMMNHSSSQKTRLSDLSYGIKIWTDISYVLSCITHLTDRRTDRILIARPRLHCMQCGKNECENCKKTWSTLSGKINIWVFHTEK